MKIKRALAKLRLQRLFLQHDLEAFLEVLRKRGLKIALRHARLRKKIYKTWLKRTIKDCDIFDSDFYVSRYVRGEVVIDPFDHYLKRGIYYDLAPNASFNPVWYRLKNMPSTSRLLPALHYAINMHNNDACLSNQFPSCKVSGFSSRLRELQLLFQIYQINITPHSMILDFGCGDGETVAELRDCGFQAFGYDVIERPSEHARKYRDYYRFNNGAIDHRNQLHNVSNYTLSDQPVSLPYNSASFDLVISYQTFEHVFNIDSSLAEIARILKPGGAALHIYPPKECFMERHYNIPLGHRLHYKWYFALWAALGLCGNHRKEYSRLERGRLGYLYVQNATNYTASKTMLEIAKKHFSEATISPWPDRPSLNIVKNIWARIFPHDVLLFCRKRDE